MRIAALLWLVCLLPLAVACTGEDDVTLPATADDTDLTTPAPAGPTCDLNQRSGCDTQNSILRGSVRLPEGFEGRTRGDLFLALNHEIYDGEFGGGYHTHLVLTDVDLTEPVPFALDMCADGAVMWSEDNCGYSLLAILDHDGDQTAVNMLPDADEPATRVAGLRVSCDEEPACLDVVLDCTDGPSCAQFEPEPVCECDFACGSAFALCSYY